MGSLRYHLMDGKLDVFSKAIPLRLLLGFPCQSPTCDKYFHLNVPSDEEGMEDALLPGPTLDVGQDTEKDSLV
jgi:hypothetical protein